MRVLILALAVMEILISEDSAKGGPSTANHVLSASVDPATFTEEATQGSEDQIGLDKGKRRDVQRPLTDSVFLWSVPDFPHATKAAPAFYVVLNFDEELHRRWVACLKPYANISSGRDTI